MTINKSLTLALTIIASLVHQIYGAEIKGITKSESSKNCPVGDESLFTIGNKSFGAKIPDGLTKKQMEIFLEAAKSNQLRECLIGTDNQLFCKLPSAYCCCPRESCIWGVTIDDLSSLPSSIKKGLEVKETNDDCCCANKSFVVPGCVLGFLLPPYTGEAKLLSLCLFGTTQVMFAVAQRLKQRWFSRSYSVEKDEYI